MTIQFTRKALRDLNAVPQQEAARIMDQLAALEPLAHVANLGQTGRERGVDIKRLTGSRAFRIRCGDWRALVEPEGPDTLTVLAIANRKDVYR